MHARAGAGRGHRRRRELHIADQGIAGAVDPVRTGAWLVALIKPQFEAGRAAVGKRGIVRDPAARQRAVDPCALDRRAARLARARRHPLAHRRRLRQRGVPAGGGA